MRSIHDLLTRNRWGHRFNLSQVGGLIAIQCAFASTIMSGMDGDFYTTLRWRLLRGFMLWFYGRRCMRCGSTYRVEVDHIIARARGELGREYQWMPRNLQILCHEHNQEKMIRFDDWRPLWARVLMPVRDTPAAHRAEIRAAFSPHEYCRTYATRSSHVAQVGCSYPLSPYPGNTQRSFDGLRNNPEPIDQSEHWHSRKTIGRLATVGWDVDVVLTVVSIFLLVARIVGHCVGFKWRW
jgi:5-methylcytosine-specific restriction endonuclease McrA